MHWKIYSLLQHEAHNFILRRTIKCLLCGGGTWIFWFTNKSSLLRRDACMCVCSCEKIFKSLFLCKWLCGSLFVKLFVCPSQCVGLFSHICIPFKVFFHTYTPHPSPIEEQHEVQSVDLFNQFVGLFSINLQVSFRACMSILRSLFTHIRLVSHPSATAEQRREDHTTFSQPHDV